jgi:copper homeostasis protein
MEKIIFEVCANSFQSAVAAELGGADRIELCTNLEIGGTTPSAGMISLILKKLHLPVYVIIRPRSFDFVYDLFEFAMMKEDIKLAKQCGAAGVVLGILKPHGEIDVKRTSELVKMARPIQVTFHRAFDRACDPLNALEDVIKTGADRVLTSGQATSAFEGKELLKKLVEKAAGRITIIAGAGIHSKNVSEIIDYTGVTEVHASCSRQTKSLMKYNNGLEELVDFKVTDEQLVKRIATLLQKRQ